MRLLWRALAVLGTFVVTGFIAMHVVVAHAVARGTPEYSVRLAGAMAGLFLGGAAAVLVTIALLIGNKRSPSTDHEDDS